MNRLTALLPMKANSTRVKGKNFRELAGKPLFQWILETLLSIDAVDQIVINTDAAPQLRACGLEESSRVVIRPRKPELCGDEVSMNLVLADDVQAIDSQMYLMTHTTNPLLSQKTITSAIDTMTSHQECDSLFTVNRFQTRFYRANGTPVNHDPDNLIPTQELEPWYEENSCMYLFSRASFLATNARIGKKPYMLEIPKIEAIDIDEPEDWDHASALAHFALAKEN